MKKLVTLLLSCAMALTMVACSNEAETEEVEGNETEEVEGTETEEAAERVVTVTDMSGDEVTITGEVETIINLWPAGTSSFFVMGAGDLVTALAVNNSGTVNSWSELFYPGASDITALGGTTPTVEEIIALDPDLVIIHPMSSGTEYAQQIRDAGIPAININFSDYDTMIEAYTMLGEVLGGEYQTKLEEWCEMVTAKQDEVAAMTEDVADEDKPVVYYIAGQADSLTTTMGSNSICAAWTQLAGGVYLTTLLDDTTTTEVTAEEIFAIDPDIIIVGGIYQHTIIEELSTTEGWSELTAVQNGQVYGNPYGSFAWDRFGLESYMQIEYALLCIQPEIAAANGITTDSIAETARSFYSTFTGIDLTDEQLSYMMGGYEADGSDGAASSSSGSGSGSGSGQGSAAAAA